MTYPNVDKIIIGYGPLKCMSVWRPDSTLEKIKGFPDSENKIVFVEEHNQWDHPADSPNMILRKARELGAGYYVKVDGDEVFTEAFWEEIKRLIPRSIKENKPLTCKMLLFWRDFNHIIHYAGSEEYRLKGFPIINSPYLQFRHPDFLDKRSGLEHSTDPRVDGNRLSMSNLMHHYSYVKPLRSIFPKICYYDLCWRSPPRPLKDVIARYLNPPWWTYVEQEGVWQHAYSDSRAKVKLVEYGGPHPDIMKTHPFCNKPMEWEDDYRSFKPTELLSGAGNP